MTLRPLAVGAVLRDRYTITRLLKAESGVAVYLAKETGRELVIKELSGRNPDISPSQSRSDYQDTLKALLAYRHPRLARVLDHFVEGSHDFVVLEFVPGPSLAETLVLGSLDLSTVVDLVQDACDALDVLHNPPAPFYFGPLSPTHLLLDEAGHYKLGSYNLSRLRWAAEKAPALTSSADMLQQDFVELGRLFYLLVVGQERGDEPLSEAEQSLLDPVVARVIDRLLLRDRGHAFPSGAEVKQSLLPLALRLAQAKARLARRTGDLKPAVEATPPPPPVAPSVRLQTRLARAWRSFLRVSPTMVCLATVAIVAGTLMTYRVVQARRVFHREGPAYVVACRSSLLLLDAASGTALARRELPSGARSARSLDGGEVFLVDDREGRHVAVYNPASNSISDTIDSPVPGTDLYGNGEFACLASDATRRLFPISPFTYQIGGLLAIPQKPSAVLDDAHGHTYVSDTDEDRITLAERGNKGTFGVTGGPQGMALDPTGKQLWVACSRSDHVKVVDLKARRLFFSLHERLLADIGDLEGHGPTDVMFGPEGAQVYVMCPGSNNLSVLKVATRTHDKTIPLPGEPVAWALASTPRRLLVATRTPDRLVVLDTDSQTVLQTLPLDAEPVGVGYAP